MDCLISLIDYYGRRGNDYPAGKLWDFLMGTDLVIAEVAQPSLIPQADTCVINGSSHGMGKEVHSPDIH